MKEWRTMTLEEREAARAGRTFFASKKMMDDCLRRTLALLEGNPPAIARAWKIAWGNYLVNTPEEIAVYCKTLAHPT